MSTCGIDPVRLERAGARVCDNESGPRPAVDAAGQPRGLADSTVRSVDLSNYAPPSSVCSVQGCEVPTKVRGWCLIHYRRWARRGGDPAVRPASATGANNPAWRGDSVTYKGAHERVRAAKGRVQLHACISCGRDAQEWAYQGGAPVERRDDRGRAYSPDPSFYAPMCASCHRRMDVKPRTSCGSYGAYRRHWLAGEPPCEKCRAFLSEKERAKRLKRAGGDA